ncbi:putative transmembrane protein [Apostichopus japonicus]|uniref:Transmembrane protein 196 n=1 Tax=Stichopus japonicus TaxID=307972 RepID=A0A2G8LIC5_STIJA|nr:putative transmembrane protein [Apostichopus japonicus]
MTSNSNRSNHQELEEDESESSVPTHLTLLMIQIVALCLAIPHLFIAAASVLIGLALVSKAPVVLANTIAPIWSGGIYFVTGLFGLFAVKRKTSYTMCCFAGFSVVSLMAGTISLQLLRVGIIDNTTDGQVSLKEDIDTSTVVAMALAGAECITSVLSGIAGFMLANSLRQWSGLEETAEPTKEQLMAERQEEIRKQKQQEKRLMQKARLARTYQKM